MGGLSYDIRKSQYWGIGGGEGGGRRRVRVRGGDNKKKMEKREDEKKIKQRKYRIATGGHTGHG